MLDIFQAPESSQQPKENPMATAYYLRVSSKTQDHRSQEPDLQRYADAMGEKFNPYPDTFTGKSMDRPGWNKLMSDMRSGKVNKIVCWRLDRLGRTAAGLTQLFNELIQRRVGLVSLKDGIDLSTPAGRMIANVLASIAQFEGEVRNERQIAGIQAAKAKGKKWGGWKKGLRRLVTDEQINVIRRMKGEAAPVTSIARATGLSRQTVYQYI